MELVLIAFVGTLLLMAAELRDFVRRGRIGSLPLPHAPRRDRPIRAAVAAPAVTPKKQYLYDAAA
jgi:hypothetical protein